MIAIVIMAGAAGGGRGGGGIGEEEPSKFRLAFAWIRLSDMLCRRCGVDGVDRGRRLSLGCGFVRVLLGVFIFQEEGEGVREGDVGSGLSAADAPDEF